MVLPVLASHEEVQQYQHCNERENEIQAVLMHARGREESKDALPCKASMVILAPPWVKVVPAVAAVAAGAGEEGEGMAAQQLSCGLRRGGGGQLACGTNMHHLGLLVGDSINHPPVM